MEHNFLPYLYKIRQRKNKIAAGIILTLAVVIIINTIIVFRLLGKINNTDTVSVSLNENRKQLVKGNVTNKDVTCLIILEKIGNIFENENNCKKISVDNDKTELNIAADNADEYEEIIKKIESSENIKIVGISMAEMNGNSDDVAKVTIKYNAKPVIEKKHNSSFINDGLRYSDIIHLVNSYNGKINDFKVINNMLNVKLRLEGDKEKIGKFTKQIEVYDILRRINSVSLEKKSSDNQHYELNIDIEFKV